MKKRLLAITSVIIMIFLTACSSGKAVQVYSVPKGLTDLGKYNPPINMTTCMSYYVTSSFPPGQTADDNIWTQLYKNTLGINVKYKFTGTNDDYIQIMNTYISSGQVPDVFTVTADQLAILMKTNMINKDLGALFAKYATNTTKQVTGWDGGKGDGFVKATVNGKLAAIPWTNSDSDSAIIMYIRKDWLDKCKLQPPKTIDQLETVLKAFVTEDPDGDGIADTIGLSGTKDIFTNSSTLDPIFNAYGSHPTIWTDDGKGKLQYGSFLDNMVTPLETLTKWYKEGLIDKGFATKDTNRAASLVQSGRCGVYFGAMSAPLWPLATTVSNKYNTDWLELPIPTATANGSSDTSMVRQTDLFHVVSSKYAHPEALILMMNAFTEKLWGPTEEFNKYYGKPGAELYPFALFQSWPLSKNLDAYKAVTNAIDSGNTSKLNQEQLFYANQIQDYLKNGVKSSLDANNWAYTRIFYTGGSQNLIDNLLKNKQYTLDQWNGLGTQTLSENVQTVQTSVTQLVAQVMMGQKSINDFKTAISQLKNNYGIQMTDEVNSWYAKQSK